MCAGKQAENPLVLLGQYSDDELDDGSSGERNKAEDSCAMGVDNQEKLAAGGGSEDFGVNEGNGSAGDKLGQLAVENGPALTDSLEILEDVISGIHATGTDVLHDANGLAEQVAAASTSDTQVAGDVSSGWKVVLHEESNQYYYWNIATGETSWEVPSVLPQATELKSNVSEQKEKDVSEVKNHNSKTIEGNIDVPMTNILDEGYVRDALDDKQRDHGGYALDDLGTLRGTNVSPGQSDDVLPTDGNATGIQLLNPGGCYETGTDFPSLLMKQSENLLEQLNIVKGLKGYSKGLDHIPKYILEVEMRLSDIKSLACHGSSLLPFWEHSERRLQELEAIIYNMVRELKSEQVLEVGTTSKANSSESICDDIKANSSEEKTVDVASDDFGSSESAGITESQKNNPEMDNGGATGSEDIPSDTSPIPRLVNAGDKVEARHAVHQELNPKASLHTGEEMDMDIDMEVEDVGPPNDLNGSVPSVQHNVQTLTADLQSSVPLESCSIPPPPDEDWIPPPPPDNEPFPPPPPDESPEISGAQPSDLVSIQSFSYVEPYNIYPSSHFQYYAQGNSNIATSNIYAQTDGCQPTVSQPPLYFEALSDTYGPATLAVNPIDGLYYGLQDRITQPVSLDSSVFHGDTVQNSISNPTGSLEVEAAVGSASLLKGETDVPAICVDAKKASLEPSSSEVTLASATISEPEAVSESSVPATTSSITASATASKPQSKVQRNKKRTVAVSSLRSNKKVSSLVDKWKAAKEELQEDEKEPENAYEILEKKRRREIEEWHAQQIASGEAKANANFQPLGGDWRERVKRKRAQLAKESVQTPKDDVSEGSLQPDLDELSKGLPRGWRAYWDISSKQVYYGNTLTTETTWVRPTA